MGNALHLYLLTLLRGGTLLLYKGPKLALPHKTVLFTVQVTSQI